MINNEDFIIRLQKVIDFYNENASSFAEKIGVQRSSISHILSGRNKPSLDFVMKVISTFPEVELYWLLNGKGLFPGKDNVQGEIDFENPVKETKPTNVVSEIKRIERNSTSEKTIERIVIFYSDGSFKSFEDF
ncbi:helix-turn-helix transcriptional regulator [Xanthomarina sp.]|uniref:helix-turn-helix domain-containing protein n=1 Tax=Xanthomarina sp. TaxID=1931211 RepID=UPI002C9C5424|nr:helix-turn-helix transcriptional regulator [Xanthomarina sp.]HLV40145.1 helix-turn-helix transcriptional regulator [Xanthomarina sp.]